MPTVGSVEWWFETISPNKKTADSNDLSVKTNSSHMASLFHVLKCRNFIDMMRVHFDFPNFFYHETVINE